MEPVPSTSNQQGLMLQKEAQDTTVDADQMQTVLTQLDELDSAIREGNLDSVKKKIYLLEDNLSTDKNLLTKLCSRGKKFLAYDLIISACKHKQSDILFYLFHSTNILESLLPSNATKTSLDLTEVDEYRRMAFYYAMCSDSIDMVEMLYDHWRGDLHWSANNNQIIESISRLGVLLLNAYNACHDFKGNQNMKVGVHCYIKFNEFQHKVYTIDTSNQKIKGKLRETEAVSGMEVIRQVLCVYNEYSDINNVRLPKETENEEEQTLKRELEDKSSLFNEWRIYLQYEQYFLKLDFYVSLLILDKLNILKVFYKKVPAHTYQQIECEIYQFIYRLYEGWSTYFPKNTTLVKEERRGLYNGQEIKVVVEYDPLKIIYAPVLFLERRKFKTSLINFIINIETSDREISNDLNYLKNLPHMRDYYSLKKMVYYMGAAIEGKELSIELKIIIERALQVIGEMMKSGHESIHLSPTTKALLQMEISVETINSIKYIRNYISHTENGEMNERIEIAKNNEQTFRKIQKDLKNIIDVVNSVIDLYKQILNKSFLQNGLDLVRERIKEWPPEARRHKDDINNRFKAQGAAFINAYQEEVWSSTGLTEGLLKEIAYTLQIEEILSVKMVKFEDSIMRVGVCKLPKYILSIKNTLELIKENNQRWDSIKHELKKYNIIHETDGYPKKKEIDQMLTKLDNTNLLEKVRNIKEFSEHWESIKNVLRFFLDEVGMFNHDTVIISLNVIYNNVGASNSDPGSSCNKSCDTKYYCISNEARQAIYNLIISIEKTLRFSPQDVSQQHTWDGIEEFKNMLISIKNSKSNTVDDKVELLNKRHKLLSNLINRVDILKITLGYPQEVPLGEFRLRYMQDKKLRILVEMLLHDIGSIFTECNIKSVMTMSTKILSGLNLRNVLAHGNPFFEVIGDVLDPRDFSTELLSQARKFVGDGDSIKALYKLFKDNVNYETIRKGTRDALNDSQKKYLAQLRICKTWNTYLELIHIRDKKTAKQ